MDAMKDSGIEWIGEIPEHWGVGKVKHFYNSTLGKMLQPAPKQETDELCSYMCAANVTWSGIDLSVEKKMWFSPKERESYRLSDGDLLVTEGGDVGVACIWKGELPECYIQNALHRVRPISGASNSFLYYWLQTVKSVGYIDMLCNKATLAHFTKDKLDDCVILAVPSDEQRRIAAYLDSKCSEIDALIAAKEKTNALLKERRQSIIYEAVTKGLNPNAPMKPSGVEWIGEIPEGWKLTALKRIGVTSTGSTPSKANPGFWDGDVPWFSSKDLKMDFLFDSEDHITQDAVDQCGLTLLPEGSLVFCVRSGILRHTFPVAITMIPATINQDLRAMTLKQSVLPDYLLYYLKGINDVIIAQYQKTGATVESIEMEWLNYLPVLLPDMETQVAIAEYLKKACTDIDAIIDANFKAIEKLKEYRQSVIFEAVTGKTQI